MKKFVFTCLLLGTPLLTFAASAPLAPQATIKIPGGQHGIGFDDIGYVAALNRVTIPADATGNLVLIDPGTDALSVIPGVSATPANHKQRREASHGIAIDEAHDHVFVACGEGKVVTLAPAEHGKLLASARAGAGIDIISYGPRLHHLYVPAARAATLTIFNVSPAGAIKPLAIYKTAAHAHCVTNDTDGHVFVCDPHGGDILEIDDR